MELAKILISACLLGEKVRYDGLHSLCDHPILKKWKQEQRLIPICPEMAVGLPTPRPANEIIGIGGGSAVLEGRADVVTATNLSNTKDYLNGANKALELAIKHDIAFAILKARSPSCGNEAIYDGTFQGNTTPGMGVTAALLDAHGIRAFNEAQLEIAYEYDKKSLID